MSKPKGKKVEVNLDPYGIEFAPKVAEVVDLLSVQFTCKWTDGTDTLSFCFYADEGTTWRNVDE